jgi:hypothetical protein
VEAPTRGELPSSSSSVWRFANLGGKWKQATPTSFVMPEDELQRRSEAS